MTAREIDDLAGRFQSQAISRAEWTHLAHLTVGAWHVHHFGAEAALERLRDGIRRLNERNGVVNSPRSGYHETITRAYVVLLAEYLGAFPDTVPVHERIGAIAGDGLAAKDLLLRHYSKHRLMSSHARAEWVEPDLQPLSRRQPPEQP
jgi:hypothetical protein